MRRALVALALALGCATPAPEAGVPPGLVDAQWVVVEIDGEAPGTSASRLSFGSDGSASGSGGCNSFHGSVTFEGDRIGFGPLASTMMMCPDPIMAQEQSFFAALAAANRVEQEGSLLRLYDDRAEPRLRFISEPPP